MHFLTVCSYISTSLTTDVSVDSELMRFFGLRKSLIGNRPRFIGALYLPSLFRTDIILSKGRGRKVIGQALSFKPSLRTGYADSILLSLRKELGL